MAAMVSQAEAKKAIKKNERMEATLRRLRDEHETSIESATRTGAAMIGAFGTAWWAGRYPDKREVFGLDSSLVVGAALNVAALMGWAGKSSAMVEALGVGALSTWAATKGHELGNEQKDQA